jgi:hypothetical protein
MFPKTDKDLIKGTIRLGGWFAIASGLLTAGLTLVEPPYWSLVDAAIFIVLGFFILRKDRIAATLNLLYFIISKIDQYIIYEVNESTYTSISWDNMGHATYLFAALWLLVFIATTKSTFTWHSVYANSINADKQEVEPKSE